VQTAGGLTQLPEGAWLRQDLALLPLRTLAFSPPRFCHGCCLFFEQQNLRTKKIQPIRVEKQELPLLLSRTMVAPMQVPQGREKRLFEIDCKPRGVAYE